MELIVNVKVPRRASSRKSFPGFFEIGIGHSQWFENSLTGDIAVAFAKLFLENHAEEDKIGVGVLVELAGREVEVQLKHRVLPCLLIVGVVKADSRHQSIVGQTGLMSDQMSNGNVLPFLGKVGQDISHGLVELDLGLFDQLHDQCGGERLSDGADIETVGHFDRCVLLDVRNPVGFFFDRFSILDDQKGEAGNMLTGHLRLNVSIDRVGRCRLKRKKKRAENH